jgi:branched-chain amino acid transport system substrate-binding protein
VRNALEKLGPYAGLLGQFDRPFSAERHDALSLSHVFMARYAADGAIEPIPRSGR